MVPNGGREVGARKIVQDWPVLDLGIHPRIDPARWTLRVFGAVQEAITWDWTAFRTQPQVRETTDIHCVTTWSRYDNHWEGVSTRTVLDAVGPLPEAAFVVLHSQDGYTTNLPLADSPLRMRCWPIRGRASR